MNDSDMELEEIKKKKLEELKKQYMNGGKNMEKEMPNKPIEITDGNIKENIEKYEVLVVDCWAPWCGPCKMLGPVIDALANEMQGKVVFGKLLVDENRNTAGQYGIMSIPTLLVFKNGQVVDNIVGALPKEMLKVKFETYL